MDKRKRALKTLLKRLKCEATGYILAYDPRGETRCACRVWLRDETGPWFHGYGISEEEAIEDCLNQLLAFKERDEQEKEKALS